MKLVVVERSKPSVSVNVSDVLAVTADGVPLIRPEAVSSIRPAGSVPDVTANRAEGTAVKRAGD